MQGVYFIAGIYGTGKTTLGKELSPQLGIPYYEASELIKKHSGEKYGATKHVKDIKRNQNILAEQVSEILKIEKTIILAGHFVIFDKNRNFEAIPSDIFEQLDIIMVILLEANTEKIIMHLRNRDSKNYTQDELSTLAKEEKRLCLEFTKNTNVPLLIHKMNYKNDSELLKLQINETLRSVP